MHVMHFIKIGANNQQICLAEDLKIIISLLSLPIFRFPYQ